jgi:hypothetical protein
MTKVPRAARVLSALFVALLYSSANAPASVSTVQATSPQRRSVIEDVRKYADRLNSAYGDNHEADLAQVLAAIGGAKIVAVGEATHGTGEFIAIKAIFFLNFRTVPQHSSLGRWLAQPR